jgi:DNA-binding response OmpR family regulator
LPEGILPNNLPFETRESNAMLASNDVGNAPLILVIDDTPEILQALLPQIRAQGWRLSLASEAYQGLQRALALRPDLILLDVRMPQMDGFTLCRLLREAPATRDIPVIFLTSANSLDERLEGLGLGCVDYVLKPFEPEEVLARMRIHLQLASRNQTVVEENEVSPANGEQLILQAALRLIGQNLVELPSLAEIARKVGTHDKRLSVIFRTHLGTTVFAHVREMRMRRGQELLTDSCMSVQDIAEQVGFRSACNFTTAFRERHGVTPSQFRQSLRVEG